LVVRALIAASLVWIHACTLPRALTADALFAARLAGYSGGYLSR